MSINDLDNPFIVSKHIPDELFCDRKDETATLIKQITNGKDVVLVSPRRMGKTGLIHHLFRQPVISDNYYTFFVDIYAATSLREMCHSLGKTVFESLKSRKAKVRDAFFQTIKTLRAGFKIDSVTGEPTFELSIGAISEPETTLEEIVRFLEQADKRCIVAIDEFQQIADFQEKRPEAVLRGIIQQCANTSFVFSGSKQHSIAQMFQSKSRPFYQSAQLLDLKPLNRDTYSDFATRLFNRYSKTLDREVVEQVYARFDGTTWYLQSMMNELFAITPAGVTCHIDKIETALANIIDIQEGTYTSQLVLMPPRQKQLLQAIAHEGFVKSATSSAFVKKHSLDSASSVQSALKGLNQKEIIAANEKGIFIQDFFFAQWLKNTY